MTPPDTDGLTGRLLTMMGIGGVASGVADTMLSHGPAIVLGALASLVVGLALEYLRPVVRAHGERAARRLARASTPPTPPTSEP